MIDKMKKWIFDTEEDADNNGKIIKYEIHDYTLLDKIGNDIKNNNIVICVIDDEYLIRTLDFIEGMAFVMGIKRITLSENIYIFIPKYIDYKFIS